MTVRVSIKCDDKVREKKKEKKRERVREIKQARDPMRFRVLQVRARGKERERGRIKVGGTE